MGSVSLSGSIAMTSTALLRGCIINVTALASSRGLLTSYGNSKIVGIQSTACVRGAVMGVPMWGLGGSWVFSLGGGPQRVFCFLL